MRRGVTLAPRLRVARVQRSNALGRDDWVYRYGRHMLLPWLEPDDETRHYTAVLEDCAPVSSNELQTLERLACLTPLGLALLQQRLIFSTSRLIVPTSDLHTVNAPVLAELEMLEDWREAARLAGTGNNEAEEVFDQVLSQAVEGSTLRDFLQEPTRRAGVRRAVIAARRDRYGR